MSRTSIIVYAFAIIAFAACSPRNLAVESNAFAYNRIVDTLFADTAANNMITPYRIGLDSHMNRKLGFFKTTMHKARPEGTLGNWMADVCRDLAAKRAGFPVDVAILNHGGIRLPEITKGDITLGHMYELMPFDNELVVAKVSGATLFKLCKLIVSKGGDPVSGLKIETVKNKLSVFVNGNPLNPETIYTVATSDYLYNGGDAYTMFNESVEVIYTHELVRDALINSFNTVYETDYRNIEGRISID